MQVTANGGGALQNQGVIEALDGSTISIADNALANYSAGVLTGGTYRVVSTGVLTTVDLGSAKIQTNNASIEMHGANSAFAALAALAENAGSLSLSGGREFSTEGALNNSGEIHALADSRLSVMGNLTSSSSSLITGSGHISGSSLHLGGTLAPGDDIGTLSLMGNTELFATTRLLLQLGSSAEIYDQLSIEGSLTLDGSLDIIAQAGFGAGEYRIANYAGSFTDNGLELGDLPAGYSYQVKTDVPGHVILSVSVPEPSTALLASIGLLKLLNRRPQQRPSQKTRS
jgi:fibronectin-binding autotransporter adhesin